MKLFAFLWLLLGLYCVQAGTLDRAAMERAFPPPFIVGDKDRDLPVWPIFKQAATSTPIVAYAFESLDLVAIPGFSGTPFNLLVALDTDGKFMDVKVLSQHEPVFLEGLGEKPLFKFVEQYSQLSVKQSIKIGSNQSGADKATSANVYIDGVAKATASVRILNQSLLAASLKVARAKMGYGAGKDPELIARIRPGVFNPMDWGGLLQAGLLTRHVFRNDDVEKAFQGTAGEGLDPEALAVPDQSLQELYFAYLDVPSVGRNLLEPADWEYLQKRLDPGDHALLVVGTGRYPVLGDNFMRGTVPDRLTLAQQGLPLEMRDMDLDARLLLPERWAGAQVSVFRVIAPAGLDPAEPLDFALWVTRSKGQIYPEVVRKPMAFRAQLPGRYVEAAATDAKTWRSSWIERWPELGVLLLGLGVLAWALRKPEWLGASQRRLGTFRTGYLLFTLCFIGWYAQGQLSVVNFVAFIQAMLARQSLVFFLYDPMTVLLWAFTAVTFFVWGRGTFCGWLCPFGALQELVSKLSQRLGIRPVRVSAQLDARLKWVKYFILGGILLSACVSVAWSDRLVEVEPFKTSITLNFVRAWPYVVWALCTVGLSAFVYKGYCRYLCPLGAGMSVLGRLRQFDWIKRRTECGQPCQRCRSDCTYQAINKAGKVDYGECFQCMDCVVVYESKELCVPVFNRNRKAASQPVIPIIAATTQGLPSAVAGGTP
jgi:transcriptional regulator of nitric oxide reductase/polyferredoxin